MTRERAQQVVFPMVIVYVIIAGISGFIALSMLAHSTPPTAYEQAANQLEIPPGFDPVATLALTLAFLGASVVMIAMGLARIWWGRWR